MRTLPTAVTSFLFWRRCDTLCTSGFVDGVMFAHNGREYNLYVCVCVRVAVWHLVAQILYFIGALLVLLALVFSQMQLCCRRERASTIRTLSGILLFSCENTSQLTVV